MSGKGEFNQMTTAQKGGTFVSVLKSMQPQIAAALPTHMNADRVLRLVTTEFRRNPKLGECTAPSVGGAIVMLSQMGLEIGVMGQGYLVPYYNNKSRQMECQGIPGWQGIVDLITRTGRATVWTGAVYPGDFFEYEKGASPFIKHRDGDTHGEGPLLYTYAVGRVNGAEWPNIDVWSNARLVSHRDKFNKVGDSHYSFRNWEMYARKVPLLQVAKYMPKSVELQRALELEGAAETGTTIDLEMAMSGDWGATTPQADPQPQPEPTEQQKPAARTRTNKPASAPAEQTEPKPSATPSRSDAPPQSQDEGGDPFTLAEIMQSIQDAKTDADVDEIEDVIRSMSNEKDRVSAHSMAKNKRDRLKSGGALKME